MPSQTYLTEYFMLHYCRELNYDSTVLKTFTPQTHTQTHTNVYIYRVV